MLLTVKHNQCRKEVETLKRLDLKVARVLLDKSQGEIGKYLGISAQEYSKIEGGLRKPSLEQAKVMSRVLKIELIKI